MSNGFRRVMAPFLGLVAVVVLGLAAPAATPAGAAELLVSAAASLTNAVADLAEHFEADNPGVRVTCNFASSGTLLRQLEQRAPVDVFASADQNIMDQAEKSRLVRPATRVAFAANTLVLIATPRLAAGGFSLEDLRATDRALLAVGNPQFVPAGRYAYQSLSQDGLWAHLEGRLVLANSVRQVLDYVARGEVGAGVVYATDAIAAGGRVRIVARLQGHRPIVYPAAATAASKQPQLARRFVAFMLGDIGQRILGRHGFAPPPADGRRSLSLSTEG